MASSGQELARAAALRAILMQTLSARLEVDIANRSAVANVLSRSSPALVINAAAYTKVDLAETNIEEARLANEIGPAVLARACSNAAEAAAAAHFVRLCVRRQQKIALPRD